MTIADNGDLLTNVDTWSNKKAKPYMPTLPSADFDNYNASQKYYDNKNSIQWCTFSFNNGNSPLVTVPVARKLTSSSVSFFPSSRVKYDNDGGGDYTPERRSVDGMYHGTPPPYRYGFTPGGDYVDLFNLETFCTSKPTSFQRKETKVSLAVDPTLNAADQTAQAALARGDKAGAQRALEAAINGG